MTFRSLRFCCFCSSVNSVRENFIIVRTESSLVRYNYDYLLTLKSQIIKFKVQCSKFKGLGSSEIWSDKLNLLHIKGTQRGGEHGGAEGTKSDRGVGCILLIALVKNVLRNLANHCFVMKQTKALIKLADILCSSTHQRCQPLPRTPPPEGGA